MPFSASHAHVQDAPIQIPIHEFQSRVLILRLPPTHLHHGDRRDHHGVLHHPHGDLHLPHRGHVHGEPHAIWPSTSFLFGDLAGFHRLLNAFTYFMQFVFVILCSGREGSEQINNKGKDG